MAAADEDQYRELPATSIDDIIIALAAAGLAAYYNSIVGNPAPAVARYYERVTNPQPGDLVVETTSFHVHEIKAVGRLIKHQMETQVIDSDGSALDEENHYTREMWYIQPFGGGVVTWENCHFVAIPATTSQTYEWSK